MKKLSNTLRINELHLHVHLGVSAKERRKKQKVRVDMVIHFPHMLKACRTDALRDTICYDLLVQRLQDHIATEHYCLIEHLTAAIHICVLKALPARTKLEVIVTKWPPLKHLIGGVSFSYRNTP